MTTPHEGASPTPLVTNDANRLFVDAARRLDAEMARRGWRLPSGEFRYYRLWTDNEIEAAAARAAVDAEDAGFADACAKQLRMMRGHYEMHIGGIERQLAEARDEWTPVRMWALEYIIGCADNYLSEYGGDPSSVVIARAMLNRIVKESETINDATTQ